MIKKFKKKNFKKKFQKNSKKIPKKTFKKIFKNFQKKSGEKKLDLLGFMVEKIINTKCRSFMPTTAVIRGESTVEPPGERRI